MAGSDVAVGSSPKYTLVVAVANPAHVGQLMRTAVDFASDRDGEIYVTSVIHKHASSPFGLFPDERIKAEFAGDHDAALDAAIDAAAGSSVPVHRRLLVGTSVAGAIRSVVHDVDADALVLGWQEESRPSDVILGTTVDPLVRRSPCDLFVERVGRTANGLDSVLLPSAGGPHVGPACDLAGAAARANDASVTVVSFVSAAASRADREATTDIVEDATGRLTDVAVETQVRTAENVGDAIVSAGSAHDLIVLGATRERGFRRRIVGDVAEHVGQHAEPPIVLAKRHCPSTIRERLFGRW